MLNRIRTLLVTFLLVLASLSTPAAAADLGGLGATRPEDAAAATQHYLENRTLLLMVRATFDVVDAESIEAEVIAEAKRIGAAGPSPEAMAALDRTLLAETDYFIVSLRYLALVGGATWPSDKPESTYTNDAIVLLDQLEADIGEALSAGADLLPMLRRLQQLWLLTEGQGSVPPDRDQFAGRDHIVAEALAVIAAGTNS